MVILGKYEKNTTSPLKSATIKLPENQINAIREYNINLGAFVRDMLDDSDLMQKYRAGHQVKAVDADTSKEKEVDNSSRDHKDTERDFDEEYFKFELDGLKYYAIGSQNSWEKNSDGIINRIPYSQYRKHRNEHKESDNA